MSRVKHLHPLSFTSLGTHNSAVLQFLTQHFRTNNRLLISHCNRMAALYAAVSAASVSMLFSWIIMRRNTIAIPRSTVFVLERLLEIITKDFNYDINPYKLSVIFRNINQTVNTHFRIATKCCVLNRDSTDCLKSVP